MSSLLNFLRHWGYGKVLTCDCCDRASNVCDIREQKHNARHKTKAKTGSCNVRKIAASNKCRLGGELLWGRCVTTCCKQNIRRSQNMVFITVGTTMPVVKWLSTKIYICGTWILKTTSVSWSWDSELKMRVLITVSVSHFSTNNDLRYHQTFLSPSNHQKI